MCVLAKRAITAQTPRGRRSYQKRSSRRDPVTRNGSRCKRSVRQRGGSRRPAGQAFFCYIALAAFIRVGILFCLKPPAAALSFMKLYNIILIVLAATYWWYTMGLCMVSAGPPRAPRKKAAPGELGIGAKTKPTAFNISGRFHVTYLDK